MTEAPLAQWSDEVVAESFLTEIRARFEAYNVAYRSRDAADLEATLRTHPEQRDQPGFVVRDSGAWCTYQASEVRIVRNSVTVILPRGVAVGVEFMHMFDHTAVAWAKPWIGATTIEGVARATIEILLVATWDDAMDVAWKTDAQNGQRRVLADLTEQEVYALCASIGLAADATLLVARYKLLLALEALP